MNITSIFGGYAGQMQAIIDKRVDQFTVPLYSNYLDMALPQVDLSFTDVIGRSRVQAMASIVDEDAVSPVRSRQGLEKYEGKIATISHKYKMNQTDYRNFLVLQNQGNISDDTKKRQIIDLIFNDVKMAADGVVSRLDYMFLQALSTGKITVSAATNPDGIVPGDIDLFMPSDNKVQTKAVWSTAGAKPTEDLEGIVDLAARKGVVLAKMLMTRATFNQLKNTAEIQAIFKGSTSKDYSLVTLDRLNDFLTSNGLPIIEIVSNLFSKQEDGLNLSTNPFAENTIVFVPAGKLGTVKNALLVEGDITQVPGHVYANAGFVKITKWGKNEPFEEFTRGEAHAMPSLSEIDSIFHLTIKQA